jgi:hypothetical protein
MIYVFDIVAMKIKLDPEQFCTRFDNNGSRPIAVEDIQQFFYGNSLECKKLGCNFISYNVFLPCVSKIVAFIIKNINIIILFTCLVGWFNSSPREIKKNKARSFKNCLGSLAFA